MTITQDEMRGIIHQNIIGESQAIKEIRNFVLFAANAKANVLITGPSGSGKELVANAIHNASNRSHKPMVAVNSGAIPQQLLELQLFGHEKGSFTGAHARHKGYFEAAHGGSFFLDEIGEMPLDMQVRLLRVLEERTIRRIGGTQDVSVDVRLIAATHQCLEMATQNGDFRSDLYFRLSVLPVHLPSLAARKQDIPLLIKHLVTKNAHLGSHVQFANATLDLLMAYDWPGNVRELRNMVDRAMIFYAGKTIMPEHVGFLLGAGASSIAHQKIQEERIGGMPMAKTNKENIVAQMIAPLSYGEKEAEQGTKQDAVQESGTTPTILREGFCLKSHLQDEECRLILLALEETQWVIAHAAHILAIRRTTLVEKIKRFGLKKDQDHHGHGDPAQSLVA